MRPALWFATVMAVSVFLAACQGGSVAPVGTTTPPPASASVGQPPTLPPSTQAPTRGDAGVPVAATDAATMIPGAIVAADAGSPRTDSAATVMDAAAAALPPRPAGDCKAARFCEDFEAYPVGAPPAGGWRTSTGGGGTLVVDSTQAVSGTKSILIRTPMAISQAQISRGRPLLPLPENNLHGRMMVRLTAAPAAAWNDHWDVFVASGRTAAKVPAAYYLTARPRVGSIYHWPDCSKNSNTPLPTGRWTCLQWQFDGSKNPDGTTRNEVRIWIDGAAVPEATVVRFGSRCNDGSNPEWVAPIFDSLALGWQNWNNPSPIPIEMWIDDIAIDERPIACPVSRP